MDAIKALQAYIALVEAAPPKIERKLAEIGAEEAAYRFLNAYYAGRNDITVQTDEVDEHAGVIANGNAVAFIEFGAGVAVNSGTSYPQERPRGIVDIGQYGQGKGSNYAGWFYKGEQGNAGEEVYRHTKGGDVLQPGVYHTYGNPAEAPMYHATNTMAEVSAEVVKEVLSR